MAGLRVRVPHYSEPLLQCDTNEVILEVQIPTRQTARVFRIQKI